MTEYKGELFPPYIFRGAKGRIRTRHFLFCSR
jgi:hypothetical protein